MNDLGVFVAGLTGMALSGAAIALLEKFLRKVPNCQVRKPLETSMKVRCTNKGQNLTVGKLYDAISPEPGCEYLIVNDKLYDAISPEPGCEYLIVNDKQKLFTYTKSLFQVVKDSKSAIDVAALTKAIDGMTSLNIKNREEIRAVLSASLKINFATSPAPGQVWRRPGGWTVLLVQLTRGLIPIVYQTDNFASISDYLVKDIQNWDEYEYIGVLNPITGKIEP